MNKGKEQRRLKGLRVELNITQKELAALVGISERAFSFKESGKTEFLYSEAKRISEILDKPIEDIFL